MKKLFYRAALLLAAAQAACTSEPFASKEEEAPVGEARPEAAAQSWTLTVEASSDSDALTKALEYQGGDAEKPSLGFKWQTADKVELYLMAASGGGAGFDYVSLLGTLHPDRISGASATLSGEVSVDRVTVGSVLTLWYTGATADYSEQDGLLNTLSSNYDLAVAQVTVDGMDGASKTITTTAASFKSSQAICAFRFTDTEGKELSVKQLTIASAVSSEDGGLVSKQELTQSDDGTLSLTATHGAITVDNANAEPADPIFVSLRQDSSEKTAYTFTATAGDGGLYIGTASAALRNGGFYQATIRLEEQTAYGVYNLAGKENLIYRKGVHQLHLLYDDEGGRVYFRILDPAAVGFTEIGPIPQSAGKGGSFSVEVSALEDGAMSGRQFEVTVEKEEGDKLWLKSGGTSFIVSK